jgi:NADH-quinone oxidoreductase subunit N
LTNLAAFGIVAACSRVTGSDDLASYHGLSRRSPLLAFLMLVAFLSLAGMPPLGGFVAKVFVFAAAVKTGWVWLAVVGVLNSIVGLYYYMTVLKYVYLYRAADPEEEKRPMPLTRPYGLALAVLTLGIEMVGTILGPWFSWATQAASGLF